MGKAGKLGVVTLSGQDDGSYSVPNEPGREGVGSKPAAVLTQNRVPGHDSRIGYNFTSGVGPHWSMTERLSPEAKVKEVKPFHRWG